MPRVLFGPMSLEYRRFQIATHLFWLGVFACTMSPQSQAQEPQPESPPKQSDAPAPAPPKSPGKQKKDTATQSAPDQPTWDPQRAEKDLEVGQYYMKKGDVDAAIDRFQDAIDANPATRFHSAFSQTPRRKEA